MDIISSLISRAVILFMCATLKEKLGELEGSSFDTFDMYSSGVCIYCKLAFNQEIITNVDMIYQLYAAAFIFMIFQDKFTYPLIDRAFKVRKKIRDLRPYMTPEETGNFDHLINLINKIKTASVYDAQKFEGMLEKLASLPSKLRYLPKEELDEILDQLIEPEFGEYDDVLDDYLERYAADINDKNKRQINAAFNQLLKLKNDLAEQIAANINSIDNKEEKERRLRLSKNIKSGSIGYMLRLIETDRQTDDERGIKDLSVNRLAGRDTYATYKQIIASLEDSATKNRIDDMVAELKKLRGDSHAKLKLLDYAFKYSDLGKRDPLYKKILPFFLRPKKI